MQVTYHGQGFTISEDCANTTAAFGFVGDCNDLFGVTKCGACGSENIAPEHRKVKGYDFYSWKCHACHKKLRLGLTKDDHKLFPKKKTESGEWLPDNGWIKEEYNADGQQAAKPQQRQVSAPF